MSLSTLSNRPEAITRAYHPVLLLVNYLTFVDIVIILLVRYIVGYLERIEAMWGFGAPRNGGRNWRPKG